jgi:hypothetical protein
MEIEERKNEESNEITETKQMVEKAIPMETAKFSIETQPEDNRKAVNTGDGKWKMDF